MITRIDPSWTDVLLNDETSNLNKRHYTKREMNVIQIEIAFALNKLSQMKKLQLWMSTITTKKHNLSTWQTMSLLQERSTDFKTSFNIFTRFESTVSILLNTACAQHHMHITTSIKSFETIYNIRACSFQTPKQNIKKKHFWEEQSTPADDKETLLKKTINICIWQLFKKFFLFQIIPPF